VTKTVIAEFDVFIHEQRQNNVYKRIVDYFVQAAQHVPSVIH
jgi:hypothetical protein